MTVLDRLIKVIVEASYFVGYARRTAEGHDNELGDTTVTKADEWSKDALELLDEVTSRPGVLRTDEGPVDPVTGLNTLELSGAYRTAQNTLDRIEARLRVAMPELVEVTIVEDLMEHAISRLPFGEKG